MYVTYMGGVWRTGLLCVGEAPPPLLCDGNGELLSVEPIVAVSELPKGHTTADVYVAAKGCATHLLLQTPTTRIIVLCCDAGGGTVRTVKADDPTRDKEVTAVARICGGGPGLYIERVHAPDETYVVAWRKA